MDKGYCRIKSMECFWIISKYS